VDHDVLGVIDEIGTIATKVANLSKPEHHFDKARTSNANLASGLEQRAGSSKERAASADLNVTANMLAQEGQNQDERQVESVQNLEAILRLLLENGANGFTQGRQHGYALQTASVEGLEPSTPSSFDISNYIHDLEGCSDSDPADKSDLVELNPDDCASCFFERDRRLFSSSSYRLSPYPLPVDTPEQEVRLPFLTTVWG
jgi:hypothetical protein